MNIFEAVWKVPAETVKYSMDGVDVVSGGSKPAKLAFLPLIGLILALMFVVMVVIAIPLILLTIVVAGVIFIKDLIFGDKKRGRR